MKKNFKTAILAAVALTSVSAFSLQAQARDFTIVGWGGTSQDVQREVYFKPFAEKAGIKFLDESWDGGYGALQAKMKAGSANWDVVQVEAEELALGCDDGLYEKLDWDKLGVKDEFHKEAVHECGAGVIYWSTAISYDGDKYAEGPKNWADFWNVEKFPGKRALRKGAKYTLEAALLADGVKADALYETLGSFEGLERAFKKLDEIKAHVVWWEAGAQPVQLLASGEVVMSSIYNGRVSGLNKAENRNFKIVWPESIYAIDSWVIMKGSEHKDVAEEFIKFASLAENQAKLPLGIDYGVPNKNAVIPAEVNANLPTAPENLEHAINLDVDFWIDNSEEFTKRFNAWLAQ
jgi:putative spermidine/putrescine transport system substrate-binding protein